MFFIDKNINHYIDLYYAERVPKEYFTQYIFIKQEVLGIKHRDYLNLNDSVGTVDQREDAYGIYDNVESFDFLKFLKFSNFFINHNIDIPRCFRGVKSLRRDINKLDTLKFNNYLMRGGKRYQTLYLLNRTVTQLMTEFTNVRDLTLRAKTSWKDFFILFSKIIPGTNYKTFGLSKNEVTTYLNVVTPSHKDMLTPWSNTRVLFLNIHKLLPLFSFYIYKVDKQIFKNTRGRSGKYTFIWKYVASYKRANLVMFWLMKELRVTAGRSISDRLLSLLRLFIFNPKQTWVWRVKKFSHNYVYRNCRYTLAETYRTTTK